VARAAPTEGEPRLQHFAEIATSLAKLEDYATAARLKRPSRRPYASASCFPSGRAHLVRAEDVIGVQAATRASAAPQALRLPDPIALEPWNVARALRCNDRELGNDRAS
jgi:hypothetical protein